MTEVYGLWILYGSAIPCTVTPIDNGQLSLREVITQEWIHAEKCTLLVNTCRGLRQVFTPRRIHFARVLLASLARSLRSHSGLRPEAFGLRPSACRRWASSLYNVCLHLNPASGVYFPKLTYPCTKREISSKDFKLPLVKIGGYSRVLELELNWLELPSNLN